MNDNAEPDYLAYLRHPANGFHSMSLPLLDVAAAKGRHRVVSEGELSGYPKSIWAQVRSRNPSVIPAM